MKFRSVPGNPALMWRAHVTHDPGGAPSRDPHLPYEIRTQALGQRTTSRELAARLRCPKQERWLGTAARRATWAQSWRHSASSASVLTPALFPGTSGSAESSGWPLANQSAMARTVRVNCRWPFAGRGWSSRFSLSNDAWQQSLPMLLTPASQSEVLRVVRGAPSGLVT